MSIDKWQVLHLEHRTDREPFAYATAERFGVPFEKVAFWEAKNHEDFSDSEAIIAAIVSDGFLEFETVQTGAYSLSLICYSWNICRYLRDIASRSGVEVLVHDGLLIGGIPVYASGFFPDFQWLEDIVEVCISHASPHPFKTLVVGDILTHYPIEPIRPDSMILQGMISAGLSFRIYSAEGASQILEWLLNRTKTYNNVPALNALENYRNRDNSPVEFWLEPGMYTYLYQPMAIDPHPDYLGSDRKGIQGYRGIFQEIFSEQEG